MYLQRRILVSVIFLAACVIWYYRARAQFITGGAFTNLGYRLQDPLENYDLEHHEGTPEQIWTEFLSQNNLAAAVRARWPRSTRHPVIALVTCMDARLDTNEITGDTRRYYYVLRLAGSALARKDEEMLELAVANGVKVVVFTTHTDCAAEKVAADPEKSKQFPALAKAVHERQARFNDFLAMPLIRDRIARHELLVKAVNLDTMTERVLTTAAPATPN